MINLDFLGLFLIIAGFVVGLGAVTVIDLHGFLGRKSHYWTEATTRTHKVTKPLIWLGVVLHIVGSGIYFWGEDLLWKIWLIDFALILNGIFLSFKVSPYLLEREKKGRSGDLLPSSWQVKITLSFIVSFLGWWGNVLLLVWVLN